ncbi:N-acetylmuramoyl-L-alanine amidase [Rossellomorea vietnamensis]|uniref:N-acetylmuramoyl-L-alanine amidase n=1 Tax=Rossellomorea vietnamensis TaxID=218284 RepID=A0A6I6UWJ9_9BACI|nr:N-acetylmuramoyl-L-alanine amidase [Rossellomorea vietnamensis]
MKKVLVSLVVFFVFFGLAQVASASGEYDRLSGKDRFEVAANVAEEGWPSGANVVFLSNYNAFADALAATPLAYRMNAPILLTRPDGLGDTTKNKLRELSPSKVVIIGGTASISNNVVNEVKSLGITTVERISGKDRFEVSAAIAKKMPSSSKAVVANGLTFADALAIAPYASRNGMPILLTRDDALPTPTISTLQSRNPSQVIVMGGTASVSNGVYADLLVYSPFRIGGDDRYEVAANIIEKLNLPTSTGFLATGQTFADALTGSVLAAKKNAPVLLTRNSSLPEATKEISGQKGMTNFIVLGGKASVSDNVVKAVAGPLAGKLIVVDPGHGYDDPGASDNDVIEKEVNLGVSTKLKRNLDANGAYTIMTREADTYPTLSERAELANKQGADAFISVHTNAFPSNPNVDGTETYWDDTYAAAKSQELATYINRELVDKLDTNNRGVKNVNFKVIRESTMPSVLVELAFLTNEEDAAKLKSDYYREQAAIGITNGVLTFFK